ncbi:unnamed protein product, partial [Rotaria sp. Silwood2]
GTTTFTSSSTSSTATFSITTASETTTSTSSSTPGTVILSTTGASEATASTSSSTSTTATLSTSTASITTTSTSSSTSRTVILSTTVGSETTTSTPSSTSTTVTLSTTTASETTTSTTSSTSATATLATASRWETTTPASITSIPAVNVSTCFSTFTISNTNLLLSCSSNGNVSLLPINNYTVTSLSRITSLSIQGYNGARGPLQTIPPNVCFLTNLQVLNISFNRISYLDSVLLSSSPSCLQALQTLDMSNNFLNEYPSLFLSKTMNMQRFFLRNNQLESFDLGSVVLVSESIDLSNNQISKITNNANINISTYNYSPGPSIDLTNNSGIIDLTDTIYEMYGACYEIQQILNASVIPLRVPILTVSFFNINFGTSKINCTCNQYYLQRSLLYSLGNSQSPTYSLSNTKCTDQTLFYNNSNTAACSTSSAIFTNTIPRLCKINQNNGNIVLVNTTDNSTRIYPYYLTQTMNNSYCLFTFYTGGERASIDCINESSTLSEISTMILNNAYFKNITKISINNQNSLSQLPVYLCSLPSNSVDLSNQSFYVLNSTTFPCSSNTTVQNINLAYNKINTVGLTLSNWLLIDLTSNNLTQLPYSLLRSNQNSISSRQLSKRTLLLSSNQLYQFDLFAYTYADTYINLENNPFFIPINGYHTINNYEKQSLLNGPISTSVILTNQMRFLFNDQIAQNYNACESKSLNYLIDIFERIKTNNSTVEIECQCSSIYIKEYFRLYNSSGKITNRFSCSNISSLTVTQFEALTETDCLSNITLSSSGLCQFARLESTPLSNNLTATDNGRVLAIILGSVLGSVGFLFLIILIIGCIYYARKSSTKKTRISKLSNIQDIDNTRHDERVQTTNIHSPYNLSSVDNRPTSRLENIHDTRDHARMQTSRRTANQRRSSYYIASTDLSQVEDNRRQKRRRPKEPPIDYDLT